MISGKDPTTPVHAWFEAGLVEESGLLERWSHSDYTGALLSVAEYREEGARLSPRLLRVVRVDGESEAKKGVSWEDSLRMEGSDGKVVVCSVHPELLENARESGLETCLEAHVVDAPSLHRAISDGRRSRYLLLHFSDPTNIPMELVLAELQDSQTIVIKSIDRQEGVESARVSLGVMEGGSDGILYTPASNGEMDDLLACVRDAGRQGLRLSPAMITATASVGMGHRSCIDAVTIFTETEGIVVGSTSQGGILCCSEVFYLPYMEKRPFRVNAGGVHSFVYGADGRTQYMSELRGGQAVRIVDVDGGARTAPIGRMKTEVRPLRRLEAEFESGERVSIVMQDDWHVRVFGADGRPRNITELRPGETVLAHLAVPGRHVGIPITETHRRALSRRRVGQRTEPGDRDASRLRFRIGGSSGRCGNRDRDGLGPHYPRDPVPRRGGGVGIECLDRRASRGHLRPAQLLVKQLTSPVLWRETVLRMAASGPVLFQEFGPRQVVSPLIRETLGTDQGPAVQS